MCQRRKHRAGTKWAERGESGELRPRRAQGRPLTEMGHWKGNFLRVLVVDLLWSTLERKLHVTVWALCLSHLRVLRGPRTSGSGFLSWKGSGGSSEGGEESPCGRKGMPSGMPSGPAEPGRISPAAGLQPSHGNVFRERNRRLAARNPFSGRRAELSPRGSREAQHVQEERYGRGQKWTSAWPAEIRRHFWDQLLGPHSVIETAAT